MVSRTQRKQSSSVSYRKTKTPRRKQTTVKSSRKTKSKSIRKPRAQKAMIMSGGGFFSRTKNMADWMVINTTLKELYIVASNEKKDAEIVGTFLKLKGRWAKNNKITYDQVDKLTQYLDYTQLGQI